MQLVAFEEGRRNEATCPSSTSFRHVLKFNILPIPTSTISPTMPCNNEGGVGAGRGEARCFKRGTGVMVAQQSPFVSFHSQTCMTPDPIRIPHQPELKNPRKHEGNKEQTTPTLSL